MKNRQVLTILLIGLLLRSILPFADLFLVTLVLLLLLFQENFSITSTIAVLAAFGYSLLLDSPLGFFPLLLSLLLLIVGLVFQKITGKGITPLMIWIAFIAVFILSETVLRLLLTTGTLSIPTEVYTKILGTSVIVILSLFIMSFKRKI